MKRLRDRLERLADSPNLVQDLVTMLTPARLMVWFTFLNLGLGTVLAIMIVATRNDSVMSRIIAQKGLGQFVASLILLVLGGTFTIFAPLRTSGLILTPRLSRYMDQIVLSGISPTRYFFGRVLGVNAFALMMTLATVPYFVFAISMGGVSYSFVLVGILVLFVYVNVLALATLAASLANYEFLSTPGVIAIFSWLYVLGSIPFPTLPSAALLTPSKIFIEPFFLEIQNMRSRFPTSVNVVENLQISSVVLFLGVYLFLAVVLIVWIICGPLNCISLPNSTFGEVVMPGDGKRKSIFKRFGQLRRKSELCFLYENRPDWVANYEIFLRWGRSLVLIGLGFLIPTTLFHVFADEFDANQLTAIFLSILFGTLLIAAGVFAHDRSTEKTMVRGGPLKLTAGTVSAICFLSVLVIATCGSLLPPAIRTNLYGDAWLDNVESADVFYDCMWLIPLLAIMSLQFYAAYRWLAMNRWEFGKATLLFMLFFIATLALPLLPIGFYHSLPHSLTKQYQEFETGAALVSYCSPLPHFLGTLVWANEDDGFGKAVFDLQKYGPILTYALHGALAALFSFLAIRRHNSLDPWKNT